MNPMQPVADIAAALPKVQEAMTKAMAALTEAMAAMVPVVNQVAAILDDFLASWAARYRWGAYLTTGWTGKAQRAQVLKTWRSATPRQRQRMLTRAVQG